MEWQSYCAVTSFVRLCRSVKRRLGPKSWPAFSHEKRQHLGDVWVALAAAADDAATTCRHQTLVVIRRCDKIGSKIWCSESRPKMSEQRLRKLFERVNRFKAKNLLNVHVSDQPPGVKFKCSRQILKMSKNVGCSVGSVGGRRLNSLKDELLGCDFRDECFKAVFYRMLRKVEQQFASTKNTHYSGKYYLLHRWGLMFDLFWFSSFLQIATYFHLWYNPIQLNWRPYSDHSFLWWENCD